MVNSEHTTRTRREPTLGGAVVEVLRRERNAMRSVTAPFCTFTLLSSFLREPASASLFFSLLRYDVLITFPQSTFSELSKLPLPMPHQYKTR